MSSRSPVQGGVKRKRNTAPTMNSVSNDASIIKYNVNSYTLVTSATGETNYQRLYSPGNGSDLINDTGPSACNFYSTGKFLPGTKIRWEPSCSFSTTGRVYVGFTDNPEMISTMLAAPLSTFINYTRAFGSTVSFPVWQETEINFPTLIRKKRFDVNRTLANNVDAIDRSVQMYMCAVVVGGPVSQAVGGFWFRDVVSVEGLSAIAT